MQFAIDAELMIPIIKRSSMNGLMDKEAENDNHC